MPTKCGSLYLVEVEVPSPPAVLPTQRGSQYLVEVEVPLVGITAGGLGTSTSTKY
jgi:hypothetical protein